jgi:uncharacterized membrane protein
MEICILKFEADDAAENALKDVIDAQGDRKPWLHDVGTIARPLVGRVRIGASFPDGTSMVFREGDLADTAESLGAYSGYYLSLLTGPLRSMFATVDAAVKAGNVGAEAEERLLHIKEIKKNLDRDSSALVFIGSTEACDDMVQAFESYAPKVIRRDVGQELLRRLEALHRMAAEGTAKAAAEALQAADQSAQSAQPSVQSTDAPTTH